MGKIKRDMKKIHSKKVRTAKKKVKLHLKGDVPFEKLNRRAKTMVARRRRLEKSRQSS